MTPPTHVGKIARLMVLAGAVASLAGCNALSRLSDVGRPPSVTPIVNPVTQPNYRAVSLPMPPPEVIDRKANTLWRPGARAFFKDQRASRIGDILTVLVNISDEATLSNSSKRSRDAAEDSDITNLLGYEASLGRILPQAILPASVLSLGSKSTHTGVGSVAREEEITLTVAALVTQVLPNGNLVIHGRQEVRVNFEVREFQVAGIVRPEDISSTNTVAHTQIAEARIAYGGRGQITDVQQPRYGQQVLEIIFPF